MLDDRSAEGGSQAARSGPVPDGQTSILELLVASRGGPAAFDLRVSSERNWDFLEFYVNGARIQRWSGELPWQTYHFNLASGLNHLSWRYVRDANFASGLDAAFVDNVYVPLVVAPPTNVAPAMLTLSLQPDGTARILISGTPGGQYVTEATTNLVGWLPIGTNALQGTSGVVLDPQATNHRARVYRSIGR
jgi:hypothetical protein